jgi:hypothetical protein
MKGRARKEKQEWEDEIIDGKWKENKKVEWVGRGEWRHKMGSREDGDEIMRCKTETGKG